jgi:hypothetical protein
VDDLKDIHTILGRSGDDNYECPCWRAIDQTHGYQDRVPRQQRVPSVHDLETLAPRKKEAQGEVLHKSNRLTNVGKFDSRIDGETDKLLCTRVNAIGQECCLTGLVRLIDEGLKRATKKAAALTAAAGTSLSFES